MTEDMRDGLQFSTSAGMLCRLDASKADVIPNAGMTMAPKDIQHSPYELKAVALLNMLP